MKLADVFAGDDIASAIDLAFERMAVAEEIIDQYKKQHPLQAPALHAAFMSCCPAPGLVGCPSNTVYRHHVTQQCERVLAGESTKPATDAEVLWALSQCSQRAPLKHYATCAALVLFERVYGQNLQRRLLGEHAEMTAVDRRGADDDIEDFRRTLRLR